MNNKEMFRAELEVIINKYSMENSSDTPDWIIADYLVSCLDSFNQSVGAREKWYDREPEEIRTNDSPA